MKVSFLQLDSTFGSINANIQKLEDRLKNINADLLVLPELFTTGYMFQDKEELQKYGEPIPNGPTVKKLILLAQKYEVYLVVGMPEVEKDKFYDTTILVGPDWYVGKNQKKHLFYKENLIFDKGENKYEVFQTPIGNIGLMVCFDYMFPEVYRTLTLQWAEILCLTCCLKTSPSKVMTIARANALSNWVYVIAVNRVGEERGVQFSGCSEIIWPRMETLAQGEENTEDIQVVDIDISKARNKVYNEFNDLLKDRRTSYYNIQ